MVPSFFSMFKHTDWHTDYCRSTLKVVSERVFRNGLFRELKIAKELNDF